jgi:hypothetical protein
MPITATDEATEVANTEVANTEVANTEDIFIILAVEITAHPFF